MSKLSYSAHAHTHTHTHTRTHTHTHTHEINSKQTSSAGRAKVLFHELLTQRKQDEKVVSWLLKWVASAREAPSEVPKIRVQWGEHTFFSNVDAAACCPDSLFRTEELVFPEAGSVSGWQLSTEWLLAPFTGQPISVADYLGRGGYKVLAPLT